MSTPFRKPEIGRDDVSRFVRRVGIAIAVFILITLIAFLVSRSMETKTDRENLVCGDTLELKAPIAPEWVGVEFPFCRYIFGWSGLVNIEWETKGGEIIRLERATPSELAHMFDLFAHAKSEELSVLYGLSGEARLSPNARFQSSGGYAATVKFSFKEW